ncbi:MAG: dTDP-4-amino-4,6-dideoxygalactose transaminase [Bacteroidia bacterium]
MIPFNKPYYSGNELSYISKALDSHVLSGDTEANKMCERLLEKKYSFNKICLTNSCTTALEISAVISNIEIGDEVILPSFTYVSTANAFALRGAKLVFADSKTLNPNIDEDKIEALISPKTKVIIVMHYAGIACNMEKIKAIAKKYNLFLIEDAAQCINSFYKDKALGSIGDLGCFSFHETKNIHCGEGGLLAVNNSDLFERVEIVRNKGTNRTAFMRGEVNSYEWVDLGFSSIPSAISSAFLYTQLQQIITVQEKRLLLWNKYFELLQKLKTEGFIDLPFIPDFATNNAHIFYIICRSEKERAALIEHLKQNNIQAVFHYQTLHNSKYYTSKHDGRELPNASRYDACLLRLPLYFDLSLNEVEFISEAIIYFFHK